MTKPIEKSVTSQNQRTLSNDSTQELAELKALIFNANENNEAKIQFLKAEISERRYQINSEQIAEKLLEHVTVVEQAEIA